MGCETVQRRPQVEKSEKKIDEAGTNDSESPKDEVLVKVDRIFRKYPHEGKDHFTKEEFKLVLKDCL